MFVEIFFDYYSKSLRFCIINLLQFFILLEDAPLFKGEYTPIGQVVYGLEILDTITDDDRREYVLRPDFINSFKLLID